MRIQVDLTLGDILHAATEKACKEVGVSGTAYSVLKSLIVKDYEDVKYKDSVLLRAELDIKKVKEGGQL